MSLTAIILELGRVRVGCTLPYQIQVHRTKAHEETSLLRHQRGQYNDSQGPRTEFQATIWT